MLQYERSLSLPLLITTIASYFSLFPSISSLYIYVLFIFFLYLLLFIFIIVVMFLIRSHPLSLSLSLSRTYDLGHLG